MNENQNEIKLLNTDDVARITGWSKVTVQKVMDQPDFPVIKIGKENQVLLESLNDYLKPGKVLRGEM